MNASSSVLRLSFTLLLLGLLCLPCRASFSYSVTIQFCNQYDRIHPILIACGYFNGVHDRGHSHYKVTISSKACKILVVQLPHGFPIGCSIYANRRSKNPWKNPTFLIVGGQSIRHAGSGQQGFPANSAYGQGNANGYSAGRGHQNHEQLPSYERSKHDRSPYDEDPPSYDAATNDHDEHIPSYDDATNDQSPYGDGNQHLPPLQHHYKLTLNEYGVNFRMPDGQHDFLEPYQWPIKYDVYIHNNFRNLLLTVTCKIDRHKVIQTIHPRQAPMHLPLNMPPNTKQAVGCTVYWNQRKSRNAKKYYSFFAFDTTKVRGPIYYLPDQHRGLLTWHLEDGGIFQWSAAHGRSEKVSSWREKKRGFSRYSYKKRTRKPIKFRKKKRYRSSRWDGPGKGQGQGQGGQGQYYNGHYPSQYQGNKQGYGYPSQYPGNKQGYGYPSHYQANQHYPNYVTHH